MNAFVLSLSLAVRDTLRMRGSLLHTSVIIAGNGLALVLLLGLSAGIVRQQEESLLKSPSSIVVSAWLTNSKGIPLTKSSELKWVADHAETIALVIPDITKVVTVSNADTGQQWDNLTLQCTVPGDPLLAFYHADVLHEGEKGLILSRTVADKLGISYRSVDARTIEVEGKPLVTLRLSRKIGTDPESVTMTMAVCGVIDFGNAAFAYADRQMLDWMEDYQQGRSVPKMGWKGFPKKSIAAYESYLCFCREPLAADDFMRLAARGLIAKPLDVRDPRSAEFCTLGGLLSSAPPHVYQIRTEGAARLTLSVQEVEDITDVDDVVVPWSTPLEVKVNGRTARLLGTSLRKRWLQQFFVHPEAGFIANEDALIAQSRDDAFCQLHRPTMLTIGEKSFDVPITPVPSADVPLCVIPLFHPLATTIILPGIALSTPLPAKTPTVFVPSEFLAQLHALNRNEVAYDPALRLFVPLTQENLYYKGRFYARSLHDVPKIDGLLQQAGFTTQSERTRIEEIQGYARVLRLLVNFVGSIVVLCGIVTLGVVLSDNTARKRGALGVLRLMGFGRGGSEKRDATSAAMEEDDRQLAGRASFVALHSGYWPCFDSRKPENHTAPRRVRIKPRA
jgi:F0F1-type ATP synthase assembly protein I